MSLTSKGDLKRRAAAIGQTLAMLPFRATGLALGLAGSAAGTMMRGLYQGFRNGFLNWGSYHDAAKRDSINSDWRARLASADQSILFELDTLLARSRAQIANDGYAASAQGAYKRGVVGGGITARSAGKDPDSGLMLDRFNKNLDGLWGEYFWDPMLCDAEETKCMPEKQHVWMGDLFAAGGIFILEGYRPAADAVRMPLQEIEYEQRDTVTVEWKGRPVRGGIEVGAFHEPVAYHLFTAAHPLEELPSVSTRIPASGCIHIYKQERVRQRLGTPWLKTVLARMRNLAMFEQYTMTAARGQAAYVGFVEQDGDTAPTTPQAFAKHMGTGFPPGEQPPNSSATASGLQVNVTQGLFTRLNKGEKVKFPPVSQPNTVYAPFVLEQLKAIASGTGLDFPTVSRWYADANFASLRQGKLDLIAEIDWIQDLLFVRKAMVRIRKNFIETAIREGRLSATGYWHSPRWRQAYLTTNWQGPPKFAQDEIKDEAAWDMKIKSGRASPQEYCNAHGKDIRDVLAELQEFRTLAKAAKMDDVVDRWFLGGAGAPNAPKPGMKPDDPAAGVAVDDAAVGDSTTGDTSLAGVDIAALVTQRHVLAGLLSNGDENGTGGNHA